VKEERRERFKKYSNPLMFVKHYMEKEDYKPSEEVMALMQSVIKIRHKF
jgi:hypothetical protein